MERKAGRITMVTVDQAKKAYELSFSVTVNGKRFTVYPTRAAMVLKAYAREKERQGLHSQYYGDAFLKLNDKYMLYLGSSYSKDDVCKGAGMGTWDVAVPHQWQMQPGNLSKIKSGEWAVWGYDGKDSTFGRPVWRTEVFRNLKKNILSAMRK